MTDDSLTKLRAQARHEALHALLDRHRAEYDELHREARIKRGLPPEPNNLAALKTQVDRLRAELAALRSGHHPRADGDTT